MLTYIIASSYNLRDTSLVSGCLWADRSGVWCGLCYRPTASIVVGWRRSSTSRRECLRTSRSVLIGDIISAQLVWSLLTRLRSKYGSTPRQPVRPTPLPLPLPLPADSPSVPPRTQYHCSSTKVGHHRQFKYSVAQFRLSFVDLQIWSRKPNCKATGSSKLLFVRLTCAAIFSQKVTKVHSQSRSRSFVKLRSSEIGGAVRCKKLRR